MKKNYILLSAILLIGSLGFSQTKDYHVLPGTPKDIQASPIGASSTMNKIPDNWTHKYKKPSTKAFEDTLYYQDFADSLPAGYRVVNANQNNFVWKWETQYDEGALTAGFPAIKSTTASNGFMSLPSDFYNSPNVTDQMDTYFVSPKITIDSVESVRVRYQHYMLYCCVFASQLRFEVSDDSTTWTSFDMRDGLLTNQVNSDTLNARAFGEIDVSAVLANKTEFWYRVRATLNTHYFWMIDDIAFIEGPTHDLVLTNAIPEFHSTGYAFAPFYGTTPFEFFPDLRFSGNIANSGGKPNTDVRLNVRISRLGGPTPVFVDSATTLYGTLAPAADTNNFTPLNEVFIPTGIFTYRADFRATGDSVDLFNDNDTSFMFFATSDTVFARDDGDNGIGGGAGPGDINIGQVEGGTIDGDRFAALYTVESKNGNGSSRNLPTSISFAVSTDDRNVGIQIVPNIWPANEDTTLAAGLNAGIGTSVATNFVPYTVQASDLSTTTVINGQTVIDQVGIITLPLTTGSAILSGTGLDSGQYYVGWQVVGGTVRNPPEDNRVFEVLEDRSTGQFQRSTITTVAFHGNNPGVGWFTVIDPTNPAIRLNFGNALLVGDEEKKLSEVKFNIAPNPNNGEFRLTLNSNYAVSYNLMIRNLLGQDVHAETISANGVQTKQLNLSHLEKGIYFVSLENQNERLVKKVIIK